MNSFVRGEQDEDVIRHRLLDYGIQSLRRAAGYIASVMSLENEPKPMLKDWRSCPHRTMFSEYHVRWIEENYPDARMFVEGSEFWPRFPWSEFKAYPECCHLSSNACHLVQAQHIDIE